MKIQDATEKERNLMTPSTKDGLTNKLPPITRSLLGILSDNQVSVDDYKKYLMDKYLTTRSDKKNENL